MHKAQSRLKRLSGNVRILFVIPVVAKERASNWQEVESNLSRTVSSILSAGMREVGVLISYDDRPMGGYWTDGRVIPIALPRSSIDKFARAKIDKARKIKEAAKWVKGQRLNGVYIMLLDADDLVSHRLIRYVLEDDNRQGYNIVHGYRFDLGSGNLEVCLNDFHSQCGSCFIGYFYNGELPDNRSDVVSSFSRVCDSRHRDHGAVAQSLGKEVANIFFPAVIYVVNHVNSAEQKRANGERTVTGKWLRCRAVGEAVLSRDFGEVDRYNGRSLIQRSVGSLKIYILDCCIYLVLRIKLTAFKRIL